MDAANAQPNSDIKPNTTIAGPCHTVGS